MKISEVLQLVKDGYLYYPDYPYKYNPQFICCAVTAARWHDRFSEDDGNSARDFIIKSIAPCSTLIKYLNCYQEDLYDSTKDPSYIILRDKWIDEKIKELQSKGL